MIRLMDVPSVKASDSSCGLMILYSSRCMVEEQSPPFLNIRFGTSEARRLRSFSMRAVKIENQVSIDVRPSHGKSK